MKPEPSEEPIADPVTVAQQPPSLNQGVVATGGGGVLPPATAVYHDQVVHVVTNSFLKGYLSLYIGWLNG
jgi:hypothetical protein